MKFLVKLLNFLFKTFFLEKNEKDFVNHNLKFFNKELKESKNVILFDFNTSSENVIAYSYLASALLKKYDAKLIAFNPRVPRTFFKNILWKYRVHFGNSDTKIFKSFKVNSLIFPSIDKELLRESNRLFKKNIENIKNKNELEKFTLNGVIFGDLIYDYYLNYYKIPSIDIKSKSFRAHFKLCLQAIVFWQNYFKNHNVKAVNVSHTVYMNAIPIRIAAKLGIECFQANATHVYRLNSENYFAYAEFKDYRKMFAVLSDEEKSVGIKKAKERIKKRISGEVGVDMNYSKKSAFNAPMNHRLIRKSNRIKVLVAPHCFFDSPHPFGFNLYPDVFEWLEGLVKLSKETNYDWYVKTHPDFISETKKLIDNFFKPHSKFTILPSDSSHIQIIDEGIDFGLTIYGTIGFEYAAMNIPVINASLNNPHIAYNFNINPKTRENYQKILKNLKNTKHNINLEEVYEYYFMKHIQPSYNWLFEYDENISVSKGQLKTDVYSYWIKNWSIEMDERIKRRLDIFLNSNRYYLEPNKLKIN